MASTASVAACCPVRFALETARGPVARSSSRVSSSPGTRRATVPRVSPRSQFREGWERTIRVSAPGQKRSARARPVSGTVSARASSTPGSAMSTGGGMVRERPLAASSWETAPGENASAAIP